MSLLSPARLNAITRRFGRARVLVLGDLMLDEFIWGRVERISPEAPVPVVRVTGETIHLGGAANVVHNLCALGAKATACGVIGTDRAGRRLLAELKKIGAGTAGVVRARAAVTIRKTRVVAHHQQVVRFDREQPDHTRRAGAALIRFLQRRAGDFDVILVSDYGKGVVTEELCAALSDLRQRRAVRVVVDPKKPNYAHFRNLTLATPNQSEAADAAEVEIRDERSLRAAGKALIERWQAEAILITRGEHGMSLFKRSGGVRHFPTAARDVFDVTGAGDTVAATCALALAAGASFEEAAELANQAAGVVVGKVGTATLTVQELLASLRSRTVRNRR
ncbi:MAG: D-glycero-beta-D-manno-heptose-7-phosphate kinase [Deltaproteobacteria bacterium]|nr:D-glycero-beta-D-manno-heptose-7-phosphate kinase [Deltaproteobacteria bacterium]